MRSRWGSIVTSVVAIAACDDGAGAPDADPTAPDADPTAPDADRTTPDAAAARPDAAGGVGEPPELAGITLRHNEVRATVDVPALTWDPALAAIATAWVTQCIDQQQPIGLVDHNAGRSTGYPSYVGENIFGAGGSASAAAAVDLWASEAQYYDEGTNTCNAPVGRSCGHYTQVVWRTTTKLGCALHDCAGLQFGSTIVCNYGPGGNTGGAPF